MFGNFRDVKYSPTPRRGSTRLSSTASSRSANCFALVFLNAFLSCLFQIQLFLQIVLFSVAATTKILSFFEMLLTVFRNSHFSYFISLQGLVASFCKMKMHVHKFSCHDLSWKRMPLFLMKGHVLTFEGTLLIFFLRI